MNNWEAVTLAEACEVILGQSPPGKTYNTRGEGLPFYQGKAEFGDLYPRPVKWCTAPKRIAEAGDVLVSVRAPVGPTNLCRETSAIGRGLAALRPHSEIPTRYVLYALRSTQQELRAEATGSTFEAISGTQLRAHSISLAPPDQREGIVEEIEKQFTRLDAAVASLRRIQANLKRYRASILQTAVTGGLVPSRAGLAGWTSRTLAELGELNRGKSKHRPRNDPRLLGGDYPFIQTGDVANSRGFIREHSQTYNEYGLAQSRLWPAGTLCITIAANIARTVGAG